MRNPELKESNGEVILVDRGFYKKDPQSPWKGGRLYLTNIRLFLWQPLGIIFQTLLEYIDEASIQQEEPILEGKEVLRVSYKKPGGEGGSQAWITVKDMETWKDRISELKQEKPEVSDQREVSDQKEPIPPQPKPAKWQKPDEVMKKLFDQSP